MGSESWEAQKGRMDKNPDFHLEEKRDEVEVMIGQRGWDGAFQKIEEDFDSDPDNVEYRRRLTLIIKLDDERKAGLRTKLNH